jgi:hypothetical protein
LTIITDNFPLYQAPSRFPRLPSCVKWHYPRLLAVSFSNVARVRVRVRVRVR